MGVSIAAQKMVLDTIAQLQRRRPGQPISHTQIANRAFLTRQHVVNTIKVLVDNGCLVAEGGGPGKPYCYELKGETVESVFGWIM